MEYKKENKTCQNCKKDFVIEPDDFSFYEKMKVPLPTFCPPCRFVRRISYRNERKLFKNKDAFTGEDIFSLFPQESRMKVVTQEEWYSDTWDALDYARDYDFSRPFFEQIMKLNYEVPVFNLNSQRPINSPYSANATALKNCYLCFNSSRSEDCMYGNDIEYCKDCVDNSHINYSERCYECFWLQNCYQCYFTIMSVDSRNLWFCRDCLGCNDCLGCANLRKLSYCIFNKQYTREEYFKKLKNIGLDTVSGIEKVREISRSFWNTQIIKYHQGIKNVNSTGSYVSNCKNVKDSYLVRESEDLRYCQYMEVIGSKDSYDVTIWGERTELSYETEESGENSYNVKFSYNCWPSVRDCEYSINLRSCSDCFGCVGLKSKQYCVFNKQYERKDYENLVEKIKKHMDEMPYLDKQGNIYKYGEFFPIEHSPIGYNNSIVMEHFPMDKEEAIGLGFQWIEVPRGNYEVTKRAEDLASSIDEVTEIIINEVIECKECKNPYKIIQNEFIFLKKEKLPIPHICHDCRHKRRITDRLKTTLYDRGCMCKGESDETGKYKNSVTHLHGNNPCGEKFKTGYPPDSSEIVYCEKCYQAEVY
jgi:hypothetical protein